MNVRNTMNNITKKLLAVILAELFVLWVVTLAILAMVVRWDNVPIIGPMFVLGPSKVIPVDAGIYKNPITYEQLDEVPKDFPIMHGYWFNAINWYTRGKLKKFMKQYNLGIVPKDYTVDFAIRIEELLAELEFVELE